MEEIDIRAFPPLLLLLLLVIADIEGSSRAPIPTPPPEDEFILLGSPVFREPTSRDCIGRGASILGLISSPPSFLFPPCLEFKLLMLLGCPPNEGQGR